MKSILLLLILHIMLGSINTIFAATENIAISATPSASVAESEKIKIVTWEMMEELNFETGEISDTLKQLKNKDIEIAGFIVPIEMDEYIDTVKDFLLVPDPLACIHVPPPPPNQMIYVKMNKEIPLDMDYRGVAITGELSIVNVDGIYGYELAGVSAKEANIEFDDPLMDILWYD